MCPATPFDSGRRVTQPVKEAAIMRPAVRIHPRARAGHQFSTDHHPFFASSGEQSADLWLRSQIRMSMAEFRDLRFRNATSGLGSLSDRDACQDAFNDGFSRVIAVFIANPSRFSNGGAR
jgi:hypothetical protein